MPDREPVLVLSAHPDDEVLGCGGTIARLAKEGHPVHIVIVAEGMTSRYRQPEDADRGKVASLHEKARHAAGKMGAHEPVLCGLPDNRLDSVPLLDIVKVVEGLIEKFKPAVIYTHHPGDLNVDHGVVHRALLTATRPMHGQSVREIYAFEVASSTEWAFQQLAPTFHPNVLVDISATLDAKIAALECYDTEVRPFPHPRSAQAVRAAAMRWGSVAGFEAAEAFELVRMLRPVRTVR